jgi:hypothetical protein
MIATTEWDCRNTQTVPQHGGSRLRLSDGITHFAKPRATAPAPDQTFEMTFAKDNAAMDGFNRWTINGVAHGEHDGAGFLVETGPAVSPHAKRER